MNSNSEKESMMTEQRVKSRRMIFLVLLASNLIYLALLAMLELAGTGYPGNGESTDYTDFVAVALALAGVGAVIIDYAIFIPRARKIEKPQDRFGPHVIVFVLGSGSFGIYGFLMGLLTLTNDGSVNWATAGVFIIAAIFHGSFLYMIEINPALKASMLTIKEANTKRETF